MIRILFHSLPRYIIIYSILHLISFYGRIKTSRMIIDTLTNFDTKNSIESVQYSLATTFVLVFFVNTVYNFTLNRIKTTITKTINKLYQDITDHSINGNYMLELKHSREDLLQIIDNQYIFENIFDSLILTIPKSIIYLVYYFYNIYNFSFSMLACLIVIDLSVVGFYKKFYVSKKDRIFDEQYSAHIQLKKKYLEAVDGILRIKMCFTEQLETSLIRKLLDVKTYYKTRETNLNTITNLTTEITTDLIEVIIFALGLVHIYTGNIKPMDLVFIGFNSGNFINYSLSLIDNYTTIRKYKKQLTVIESVLKLQPEADDRVISDMDVMEIELNKVKLTKNNNYYYVLTGPNGCGKTTIFTTLLGFSNYSPVKVKVRNVASNEIPKKQVRNYFTYVTQEPILFDDTIGGNMFYGCFADSETSLVSSRNNGTYRTNESNIDMEIRELINQFDVKARSGEGGDMLSGGGKKKIQIINALLMNRPIIIFDEPTNNLDVDTVNWFLRVLEYLLDKGKLVIIISHDERLINKNCKLINYNDIVN
jgi:ABC-type bacteriocin/lantibiotic exporter with double-glycine peptidase domain